MLRRFAAYRVLRIGLVAVPAILTYRWLVLREYIFNHIVHHRAQLGVYLRLNGIAVPAIYHDSADEKGGESRAELPSHGS